MASIVDKAFVLRRVRYGEQACLLELYSKNFGRLTAGSRISKRSGKSALNNPFTFAEFELRQRAERYYVQAGSVIEDFSGLREDVQRLTAACQFAELLLDNVREGISDQGIYELIAHSFYALSRSENASRTYSIAALRLLSDLGFRPWLEDCVVCHGEVEENLEFNLARGGLQCSDPHCRELNYGRGILRLSPSLRRVAREICSAPLTRIFNLQILEQDSKDFMTFVEEYMAEVFGKKYALDQQLGSLDRFTKAAEDALAKRAQKEES